MDNLIKFLAKYHFIILFLLLEVLAINLIINRSDYNKNKFVKKSGEISGFFYDMKFGISKYFSLYAKNEMLMDQLARARNSHFSNYKNGVVKQQDIVDTLYLQNYQYVSGKVISNTINKRHNYLTIDQGKRQGIKEDMAVISPLGVVGIVNSVSENYCSVISILNIKVGISGKIKKNNYFGSISWDNKSFQKVRLDEIPSYVQVMRGDTVITSGLSPIFPEGILIGTIEKYEKRPGRNFWDIWVKLSVDMKNLSYVYLVRNLLKKEQLNLESTQEND